MARQYFIDGICTHWAHIVFLALRIIGQLLWIDVVYVAAVIIYLINLPVHIYLIQQVLFTFDARELLT